MVNSVWESRMTPFKVIGNLYFVGTIPASAHLIDTGEGLILLDSGYQETLYLVLQSIHELGFNPYDIKYILHSHGHIDHLGATRALVELTGAKTVIGRQDKDYANGKRDLTFAKELDMIYDGVFEPDILLDDNDLLTLGNTTIRCLHTPGHTEGTMSFFFDVVDHGKTFRVGTHGGTGLNTLNKNFLNDYGLPLTLQDDFLKGLDRLSSEKVDVFIGNHQHQCDTINKSLRILSGEWDAFVDPDAWTRFINETKLGFYKLLAEESENK